MIKIILFLIFLPILGLTCFESKWIEKSTIFSQTKILQCFQNEEVINFNYVIRSVHCALNMTLDTETVSVLTFEWTK